ncbi:putative transmembrane and TPR repeat-containing protein 1-like [Daphnia sinensis]|uniref:dolichyl-phosphate-mannose--protein mannosyltransferase n=1 Tax=Daphnia sinensis TaxID=1820382 RepID=A0AAD5PN32_9CRUS|nr:putative transmembrane and TPR repeat-containing protein 1-like [Daphnia sinensis]
MGAEKRSHLWGGGIECESMKFAGAQHQQRVGCCCCSKSGGKRTAGRQSVEEGKHGVTLSEWLPCLIPPALALGVYTNSLGGEFVHDDLSAITANRDITDPAAGTWDFLYNDFWGTSLLDPLSHKSYRPLTILTFKWNYALSGLNPWSYHAVNVILHAAVSALFAWLCLNCLGLSKLSSLLTASLFAIHPIHTEAVSGIVGRADILTTLFFLLSFISHDRATMRNQQSSGMRRHPVTCFNVPLLRIVSLLSAFLALAAKENGIAALPVAITWDIIRLHQQSASSCDTRRCGRGKIYTSPSNKLRSRWNSCSCWPWLRVVFKCWPILLSLFTTLVLLAARIALQQGQLPLFSEQDNPAAFASSRKARILTMLYLPAFNMGLLLAPVLLSYDWQNGSIPLVEDWRDWRNVGTLFFYTSLAVTLVYAWLNRKKVILWSAAVMVWPMLPASNLFYPCGFVVAERLLYLPSLGYCLIVALGLRIVFRSTRSRWTIRAGRLVSHQSATGSYASLRRRRSSSTCSSSSSFSSSSSSSSSSSTSSSSANCWWPGRQVFARCLFVFGAILLAVSFATKTWTRNLDWADRRTLFESGLRTLPNNAKMHYNYANVQKDEGRWETAIDHYRTAIELWPNYASALNNLGTVLLARADDMEDGDRRKELAVQEAELRFREAIRSHPHHAHAHYNLAVLYLQRNETEQALHLLNQVLTLNSNHREALNLLHWLQAEKKSGNVDSESSSNGRTLNHYRNAEKTTIGAIPAAHHSPASAMPMAGHWITANRLQHQQQPKLHHQPQREESRQHRSGTTSNYRWNKTAKN